MTESERKDVIRVLVTCGIGTIAILLVPMLFRVFA